MNTKEFLAIVLLFIMIFIGIGAMSATVHGANVDINRDFDNVTIYHAEKSDSSSQAVYGLENITYIVIPEIIIDNPVIPIQNNNNTSQYNETNTDKVLNNNTTNPNNITSNINKENSIGTSTSDNIKTVTMKRTGINNPIGMIIVIILFGILILIYNREDD